MKFKAAQDSGTKSFSPEKLVISPEIIRSYQTADFKTLKLYFDMNVIYMYYDMLVIVLPRTK